MGARIAAAALLGLALCAIARPADARQAAAAIPSHYDADIRRQAERYLPAWDWRWWKAQLYAESAMRPDAVSPAGAAGLAQLMPGTHREIAAALRSPYASPHDVEYAIEAGAFYMRRMRSVWTAERPEEERRRLAQASYNAGAGNIINAQRACKATTGRACTSWAEVSAFLPRITGRHARETLGYVSRIDRLFWGLQ